MPHPQESELRNRLREFFSDAPDPLGFDREYRILIVHEPETGAHVRFFLGNDEGYDDVDLDLDIEGGS